MTVAAVSADDVGFEASELVFQIFLAEFGDLAVNHVHFVPVLLKHRDEVADAKRDEDGLRHIFRIRWICKYYVSLHVVSPTIIIKIGSANYYVLCSQARSEALEAQLMNSIFVLVFCHKY